jgi:hypothetical protein
MATPNQDPALACDLSQAELLALLSELSAKHGPGTLAALVGAAFAADVAEGDEADAERGDEPCEYDTEWLVGFAEHPAFAIGAGEAIGRMF